MTTLDRYMALSGTSNQWLAFRVGVSTRTIHRWRHGEPIGADAAYRLQRAIAIRNEELVQAIRLTRERARIAA